MLTLFVYTKNEHRAFKNVHGGPHRQMAPTSKGQRLIVAREIAEKRFIYTTIFIYICRLNTTFFNDTIGDRFRSYKTILRPCTLLKA